MATKKTSISFTKPYTTVHVGFQRITHLNQNSIVVTSDENDSKISFEFDTTPTDVSATVLYRIFILKDNQISKAPNNISYLGSFNSGCDLYRVYYLKIQEDLL